MAEIAKKNQPSQEELMRLYESLCKKLEYRVYKLVKPALGEEAAQGFAEECVSSCDIWDIQSRSPLDLLRQYIVEQYKRGEFDRIPKQLLLIGVSGHFGRYLLESGVVK